MHFLQSVVLSNAITVIRHQCGVSVLMELLQLMRFVFLIGAIRAPLWWKNSVRCVRLVQLVHPFSAIRVISAPGWCTNMIELMQLMHAFSAISVISANSASM